MIKIESININKHELAPIENNLNSKKSNNFFDSLIRDIHKRKSSNEISQKKLKRKEDFSLNKKEKNVDYSVNNAKNSDVKDAKLTQKQNYEDSIKEKNIDKSEKVLSKKEDVLNAMNISLNDGEKFLNNKINLDKEISEKKDNLKNINAILFSIHSLLEKIEKQPISKEEKTELSKNLETLKSQIENLLKNKKEILDVKLEDTIKKVVKELNVVLQKFSKKLTGNFKKDLVALMERADVHKKVRLTRKGMEKPSVKEADNITKNVQTAETKGKTISGEEKNKFSQNNKGDSQQSFSFNNIKNFANSAKAANTTVSAGNLKFQEQVNELINRAKVVVKDGKNSSFTVKLYPRELGNLSMTLGMENGVLHGKFLVDNMDAKNLLLQNLEMIRQQLLEAGIELGDFSVGVKHEGENSFEQEKNKDGDLTSSNHNIKEATMEFDANSINLHNGLINVTV